MPPMNIVPKLTLALVTGMCFVLAANGYLRVRREVGMFEADRARDHEMIGRSLAAAVTSVWRSEGEEPAMASIEEVNRHFSQINIRWLARARLAEVHLDRAALEAARPGEPTTAVLGQSAKATWYTYVPVTVGGEPKGFLELYEATPRERDFARTVVSDTVVTAAVLALLSALLAFALGQWLVGAPVRALSDAARRIGRGEFKEPLSFKRRDEFGVLASELNAMSVQLVSTMEQLRHADRLTTVGKLASGVAHELGTPLNVISARAGMIASGETTPEESLDYARVVVEAADRMTKIIRQLLQFARRKGPARAETDVRALARAALDLLAPLASKRNVTLSLAPGKAPATAFVEAGQMQQVVANLVMNAVQAMPSGGNVELSLATEAASPPADVGGGVRNCLRIRVKDAGEGIAKDVLPHVFEPFFTTKDVGEGTGLGLAVTYGIVRDHGGWILVDSTLGGGTTFDVYVPRGQPPSTPA
jgi:two-component system, NtrC family, sensor kinase